MSSLWGSFGDMSLTDTTLQSVSLLFFLNLNTEELTYLQSYKIYIYFDFNLEWNYSLNPGQ